MNPEPFDLYWVRHAPTNARMIYSWTDLDCDLSDTVRTEWLDRVLPTHAIVVSSDLKRASKTADLLSVSRTRRPDAPELREMNFGEWECKTAEEILESHRNLANAFWSNPCTVSPPGGENWTDVLSRVNPYILDTASRNPGQPIIAVAHYGVILSHYMHAAAISAEAALEEHVRCLSLSHFRYLGQCWHVHDLNRLPD